MILLLTMRFANSQPRETFLKTMGISISVGTVLGASTLPFYDQPGTHLSNLVIGASAGLVLGLGIALFEKLTRSRVETTDVYDRSHDKLRFVKSRDVEFFRTFPFRPFSANPNSGICFSLVSLK